MKHTWRLILDGKNNGYYNMAMDEALARSYAVQEVPTLRIYGWRTPCISIGYAQASEAVIKDTGVLPVVRRITGGGSIVHDQEITYSIVCRAGDLDLPRRVKESYRVLSSFLVCFYRDLGLEPLFARDAGTVVKGDAGTFCFTQHEDYDLVIKGKKIGGNAQRRMREVIFQHGSIPQCLEVSVIQENIKGSETLREKTAGLESFLQKRTDFNELSLALAASFSKSFGVTFERRDFTRKEQYRGNTLIYNKYIGNDWNKYHAKTLVAR